MLSLSRRCRSSTYEFRTICSYAKNGSISWRNTPSWYYYHRLHEVLKIGIEIERVFGPRMASFNGIVVVVVLENNQQLR